MMILRAVESLGQELRRDSTDEWNPRSILPIAVYTKIIRQNPQKPFEGVSGVIEFNEDSGEPIDKRTSILHVEQIPDPTTPPREVFHCSRVHPNDGPTCRTFFYHSQQLSQVTPSPRHSNYVVMQVNTCSTSS